MLFLSPLLLHLISHELGYASALSVVLFIVMFATRGITVKLLKKVGQ